ncbi:hypothetical protein DWZ14_16805 [Enterocloster citroniae]|nr:hypothetical protein DWZ14_16805 [Enterocloster citroniae]
MGAAGGKSAAKMGAGEGPSVHWIKKEDTKKSRPGSSLIIRENVPVQDGCLLFLDGKTGHAMHALLHS